MSPTVAVCSLFRNSSRTLDCFRSALETQAGSGIELVFSFVEGDSTDDTWARLSAWAATDRRVVLQKIDVEPVTSFEDRVSKWAALGNAALDGLRGRSYDYVLWCESDLSIPPDLVSQLVADAVDVVAPAIFLGGMFYDTWGFRGLDGRRFQNVMPYHSDYRPFGLIELASVGSTVLFRRAVLDTGLRFRGVYENGLLVGLCSDARARGFRVFLDSRVAVVHPTSSWRRQQYKLARVRLEPHGTEIPLADVLERLPQGAPLLGSPEFPAGHAVLADLVRLLQGPFPPGKFALSTALCSEGDKQYTLVIRDCTKEAACPSATR